MSSSRERYHDCSGAYRKGMFVQFPVEIESPLSIRIGWMGQYACDNKLVARVRSLVSKDKQNWLNHGKSISCCIWCLCIFLLPPLSRCRRKSGNLKWSSSERVAGRTRQNGFHKKRGRRSFKTAINSYVYSFYLLIYIEICLLGLIISIFAHFLSPSSSFLAW